MKRHFPNSAIAGARLVRTKLAIHGIPDREEKRRRDDTLAAIARQHAEAAPDASARTRVLVFSLRGWYPHTAWETVIAHGLRLRGADVHVFNCGGPMPACEVNFRNVSPALACPECRAYPEVVVAGARLIRSWLQDYVSGDDRAAILRAVDGLQPRDYAGFAWNGAAVGELVQWSVLWNLRKSTIDLDCDAAHYRRYLIAGALIATAAPKILAATRPDVILEINGQFFAEKILHTYAAAGTAIVPYEAGWRKDTIGLDRLSPEGPVDLDDAWRRVGGEALTEEQDAQVDAWVRSREGGDMQRDFYINFQAAGDPVAALGLDPGKPTAALFTNLVWDTAVMGRDRAFRSIQEWLGDTVEYFRARPARQLIIRIHPAEDLRPSQASIEKLGDFAGGLELPANVRIVGSTESLSSYALLARADAALTYTSTIGFEAAMRGVPVVVGAKVYYRGRGFTFDVHDRNGYTELLDRAMTRRLDPEQVQLARRFAHLLMFEYLKPLPVVRQRPGRFPLLVPEDVARLAPGGDPGFDTLMAQLLAGGPFV